MTLISFSSDYLISDEWKNRIISLKGLLNSVSESSEEYEFISQVKLFVSKAEIFSKRAKAFLEEGYFDGSPLEQLSNSFNKRNQELNELCNISGDFVDYPFSLKELEDECNIYKRCEFNYILNEVKKTHKTKDKIFLQSENLRRSRKEQRNRNNNSTIAKQFYKTELLKYSKTNIGAIVLDINEKLILMDNVYTHFVKTYSNHLLLLLDDRRFDRISARMTTLSNLKCKEDLYKKCKEKLNKALDLLIEKLRKLKIKLRKVGKRPEMYLDHGPLIRGIGTNIVKWVDKIFSPKFRTIHLTRNKSIEGDTQSEYMDECVDKTYLLINDIEELIDQIISP